MDDWRALAGIQALGEAWWGILQRLIQQWVRDGLRNHHRQHEKGGNDQVAVYLQNLRDVALSSPAPGQALTYNGSAWYNGTAAGGGSSLCFYEVSISVPLQAPTIPPAPTNMTGGSLAVIAYSIATDAGGGTCVTAVGSLGSGSEAIQIDGGTTYHAWAWWGSGTALFAVDSNDGSGTYWEINLLCIGPAPTYQMPTE